MTKFYRKPSLRQYEPNKPTMFGIRSWNLSHSETGYLVNLEIYKGKDNRRTKTKLGESVVLKLIEPYYNKNNILYTYSFFSTVELCDSLFHPQLTELPITLQLDCGRPHIKY